MIRWHTTEKNGKTVPVRSKGQDNNHQIKRPRLNPLDVSGEELLNPSLDLNAEDDQDMKTVLNNILTDGNAGHFKLLLESQLKNCRKGLHVNQRKWDPKVISICLGILIRSPQAYDTLKESGCIVLPSKRLLQYYKNCVKQT